MKARTMVTAVDTHCEGEPCRVITGGVVRVPGATMLEKKRWLENEGDGLRRMMLREPRGYPALCCNLIQPSNHPQADAGFIIMEHTDSTIPRHGRASWIVPRAARAHAPPWRDCMPGASSRSIRISATRGSWAPRSPAGCLRRCRWATEPASFPPLQGRPGSPP